jgi:Flagellar biosynthesis protein, FliO
MTWMARAREPRVSGAGYSNGNTIADFASNISRIVGIAICIFELRSTCLASDLRADEEHASVRTARSAPVVPTSAKAIDEPRQFPSPSDRPTGVPLSGVLRPTWSRDALRNARHAASEWWGIAALGIAIAICAVVFLAARQFMPQGANGTLRVLGRVSLSAKHDLYLLQCGQRLILVGTGPQGAPSFISELDGAAEFATNVAYGDDA